MTDEADEEAAAQFKAIFDKLDKSTKGEFSKAFKAGKFERAEQIANKEFKLKKAIEEKELTIILTELSEYIEESLNELHKNT